MCTMLFIYCQNKPSLIQINQTDIRLIQSFELGKGSAIISRRLKADMQASTLRTGRLTVDDEVVDKMRVTSQAHRDHCVWKFIPFFALG